MASLMCLPTNRRSLILQSRRWSQRAAGPIATGRVQRDGLVRVIECGMRRGGVEALPAQPPERVSHRGLLFKALRQGLPMHVPDNSLSNGYNDRSTLATFHVSSFWCTTRVAQVMRTAGVNPDPPAVI